MAYASRTGTKRNLAALRRAGWRLIVSAAGVWRTEGFGYALDNGAWSSHQQGTPWDAGRFRDFVALLGAGADWIVAPDIVAGGLDSLRLTEAWLPKLDGLRLVAVQDGMQTVDVAPLLGPTVGVFLGGSTDWKLSTMESWGRLCAELGCWYHVGRVNSIKRINMCLLSGATSFDGSAASRYQVELSKLDTARRQTLLF